MVKRIIGSILIIASALSLYLDKFLNIEFNNTFGFNTTTDLLWVVGITLCPILIILGVLLKPYKIFIFFPLLISSVQFIFIFSPARNDQSIFWQWFYGIILFISLSFLSFVIYKVIKEENRSARIHAVESLLDLQKKIYIKTVSKKSTK